MLEQIRTFFSEYILAPAVVGDPAAAEEAALRRAAAALLLEMTHVDDEAVPVERETVAALVRGCFALDAEEAEELLACAERERQASTDYFQFTSLINEHFDSERKARLVEALWRVAYADEHLSKYEEYLVRKVADLLYVPHRVFISARHRVTQEMGGTSSA